MKDRYKFLICMLIVLTVFAAAIAVLEHRYNILPYREKLEMYQMTDKHYEYVLKAMADLKPEYVEQINRITFSRNQSWIAEQCNSKALINEDGEKYLGGCHYSFSNKIFVYISDRERSFRKTLCHELLHEVMNIESDEEEILAYMIDDTEVCYEDRSFDFDVKIVDYNISENSNIEITRKKY